MNRLVPILAAALLCIGLPAMPALAGSYVSVNGGIGWTEDSDLSVQKHDSTGKHTYDTGYIVDLAVGTSWDNGLRAELEVPYRFNDIAKFTMTGSNPDEFNREISSLALMANLYYDFDTGSAWKPFVGGGIGYTLLQVEGWEYHHDADVVAYQVMAGCGYAISSKVTIDLQYRFFATQDPEFETKDPVYGKIRIDSEYMTSDLMLGLRYHF